MPFRIDICSFVKGLKCPANISIDSCEARALFATVLAVIMSAVMQISQIDLPINGRAFRLSFLNTESSSTNCTVMA
jgi:hypothetical protein